MPEEKKSGEGEQAPTTEAGEMIREEMHAIGKGKRAPRSRKQAIAIGLSRARRAGIKVPVPKKGEASETVRRKAAQDLKKGKEASSEKEQPARRTRAKTTKRAAAAKSTSKSSTARKAPAKKGAAARRTKADRSAAARKAAATRKRKQEERSS